MRRYENIQVTKEILKVYCDKCKQEIPFYRYPSRLIRFREYGVIYLDEKSFDLCSECVKKLVKEFQEVEK
jgi:hypothetical protein